MTRIAFMGTPDFAVPSLEMLASADYELIGVWTRQDRPSGRGRSLETSPVKQCAMKLGIPVHQPLSLRSASAQREIAEHAPDLIVVAAYGLILPPPVLDLPPLGCINIHGSLLPRHRGAAPIAAAILAGDAQTGVTIMRMDAGIDTGPTLARRAVPITDDDTTGILTAKLSTTGSELLAETLPGWISGAIVAEPQDESLATYSARIEKSAGNLDWNAPAALLARLVRAYQPWPSAYTFWQGRQLKILGARPGAPGESPRANAAPGTVVTGSGGEIGVAAGDAILWLSEVQLSGKRTMAVGDFARGASGFVGSHLGDATL